MSAPVVVCPFCDSQNTELFSLFGSSALTSQYYCRDCRTVFERVKWGAARPGEVAPPGGRPAPGRGRTARRSQGPGLPPGPGRA